MEVCSIAYIDDSEADRRLFELATESFKDCKVKTYHRECEFISDNVATDYIFLDLVSNNATSSDIYHKVECIRNHFPDSKLILFSGLQEDLLPQELRKEAYAYFEKDYESIGELEFKLKKFFQSEQVL